MMSPSMSGVMGSGEADEPTVPFGLKLSHGVYSIQGKRPTMEDAHFIGEPNSGPWSSVLIDSFGGAFGVGCVSGYREGGPSV